MEALVKLVRYFILTSTTAAGSGHPTTSMSAVELTVPLFFKYLKYDLENPANPANDRVLFSKGHASPLLYALYAAAGAISEEELMNLRKFDSVLEGHPTPRFKYTEAATGSLGQGLSVGVGEALALRAQRQETSNKGQAKQNTPSPVSGPLSPRVYVLLGDGELAEGSVWEAAMSASFYKLNNLVAMLDINGLGQSRDTMYGHDIEVYAKRFEAFGWHVIRVVDGHDLAAVDKAYEEALGARSSEPGAPTAIIAATKKGKGVTFIEDTNGWHGKPLSKEELAKAIVELGQFDKAARGTVAKPQDASRVTRQEENVTHAGMTPDAYDKPTATRKAFGTALAKLGEIDPAAVVLDADVQNSTYTEMFAKAFPDRFFQMFIAEQNMVGVALGLSKRGYHPWLATFACFLTRAYDQVRMASLSAGDIKICGSHAGVSIGQDGASQMGLEDLAMFRAVHGSTVLYPADAVSTEKLVEQMASTKGVVYMRTTRGETPILYDAKEEFPIGGSKVHVPKGQVAGDKGQVATIVAAGITLHEAMTAQKQLAEEGIGVRVIDAYSIKPIDEKTLQLAAKETKGMVVVEDHYPEGGLGEAVKTALGDGCPAHFIHLAVRKTPQSGKPAELLAYEEIDSVAIVKAVKGVL